MRILRGSVFALALLLAASAAHAQSASVSANVPFDFIVGKQLYPAGNYLLGRATSDGSAVILRNTDESTAAILLTRTCSKAEPADKTALTFHRFGNQYFLDQIWIQGRESGREFPRSPLEVRMARNHSGSEEITLAALLVR